MNLRGSVIPIYDLAARLGLAPTPENPRNVIVVVMHGDQTLGLLVESVSEIMSVSNDSIQITPEMRLTMEETFGPVASVYRVSSREEAVEIANQTTFGLSSAVWTTDPEEEAYFVRELEAGAVFVNGMTISYPELPFGGIKDSGFGRELSDAGIKEFCNLKTVWKA